MLQRGLPVYHNIAHFIESVAKRSKQFEQLIGNLTVKLTVNQFSSDDIKFVSSVVMDRKYLMD